MGGQVTDELTHVYPRLRESGHEAERAGYIAIGDQVCQFEEQGAVHLTQEPLDIGKLDLLARERRELLERGDRIAHAAFGVLGYEGERPLSHRDALLFADVCQPLDEIINADAVEVEALAARVDRIGDLVRKRGAQDEYRVRGWLLDAFEQRVECAVGEHVDLVDDVDLVAPAGRRVLQPADDLLAHILNARVRCGIQLVDIGMAALGDIDALVARQIRVCRRPLLALERLCQDPCGRGLAGAPGPGEQVGMGDGILGSSVSQRTSDMRLAHDVVETLRAVLTIERLMGHARPSSGSFRKAVYPSTLTRRRSASSPPSGPRTPGRGRLWLLPPGSDQVHSLPPSGARSKATRSTQYNARQDSSKSQFR